MIGQGHEKIHQHHKREPGFFAIRIQEHFEFRPDWYRTGEVRDLVLQYYLAMRVMFSDRPHLRPCRVSCRHCGILFITYPCNQGRTDLRCPFGCREAHSAKSSGERVAAYYSTKEGKTKKKALNSRRSKHAPGPPCKKQQRNQPTRPEPTELGTRPAPEEAGPSMANEDIQFDAGMVQYVQLVTSLIEGRRVSRDEILQMLRRVMRQHRLDPDRRVTYRLGHLNEKPP